MPSTSEWLGSCKTHLQSFILPIVLICETTPLICASLFVNEVDNFERLVCGKVECLSKRKVWDYYILINMRSCLFRLVKRVLNKLQHAHNVAPGPISQLLNLPPIFEPLSESKMLLEILVVYLPSCLCRRDFQIQYIDQELYGSSYPKKRAMSAGSIRILVAKGQDYDFILLQIAHAQ